MIKNSNLIQKFSQITGTSRWILTLNKFNYLWNLSKKIHFVFLMENSIIKIQDQHRLLHMGLAYAKATRPIYCRFIAYMSQKDFVFSIPFSMFLLSLSEDVILWRMMFQGVFFLLCLSICVFKLLLKDVIDSTKNQNRPQKSKKEEEEEVKVNLGVITKIIFIFQVSQFLLKNAKTLILIVEMGNVYQ